MTLMAVDRLIDGFPQVCPGSWNLSDVVIRNQRYTGKLFRKHANIMTWTLCARLCLLRSICGSFNYNEETLDCEINWKAATAADPANKTTDQWIYGIAWRLPKSIVGGCSSHYCGDTRVCFPVTGNGYTCLDRDNCAPDQFTPIEGATFIADGTPRYVCDSDRIQAGDGIAFCKYTDGQFRWTGFLSCFKFIK